MSKIEKELEFQMKAIGLKFETQYKFHPERKWKFDFAFPEIKLAVEADGLTRYGNNKNGTMRLGRHQTYKGRTEDLMKYDAAMRLGWNIYTCQQDMIKSGQALKTIEILIKEGYKK